METSSAHKATLAHARVAIRARTYWSAFSERPVGNAYGEGAVEAGQAAFKALLGKEFSIDQPNGERRFAGAEMSPYGPELGITYPRSSVAELIAAGQAAMAHWPAVSPDERAEVLIESVVRLNRASPLMAAAIMHTTGQAPTMAFQASGPNAQDRALEAIAYAYDAMEAVPSHPVFWEKKLHSPRPPMRVEKHFRIVPRGISVVIASGTFPTWNSYPGIFASLATGNAVIVKPNPRTILPLALSVDIIRGALRDAGFDPNLVTLSVDTPEEPIAKELALDPAVKIVDYTGSSEFGEWLEANAKQATVYAEKTGINTVVIDNFDDVEGMARNLAFAFCLYSGQMCTTPQNIFIPEDGISAGGRKLSFDEVAQSLSAAVEELVSKPRRAVDILGAIQSSVTLERIEEARGAGEVILDSRAIEHPDYPRARVHTPLMVKLAGDDEAWQNRKCFGPIVFLIPTKGTEDSIARMQASGQRNGAMTVSLYSRDKEVVARAELAAARAGVNLSVNFTGSLYVNLSSAFSDFHGSGANPAANSTLVNHGFVEGRYRVVQTGIELAHG
jgi:phenylacetic acid degradation protein paaN